jgi:hypothetical protein
MILLKILQLKSLSVGFNFDQTVVDNLTCIKSNAKTIVHVFFCVKMYHLSDQTINSN